MYRLTVKYYSLSIALSFFLSLVEELLLCFVFDKVYCLVNLFIIDN
jgi:hypothetical protein